MSLDFRGRSKLKICRWEVSAPTGSEIPGEITLRGSAVRKRSSPRTQEVWAENKEWLEG